MPTPDELRAAIAEGRQVLRAALEAASRGDWEKKPAAGEGEGAWSAREVAQHVIPAEAYFATEICVACGYPGVEFTNRSYATPAEALAALDEVIEISNKKIKYVTETDLEKPHNAFGSVEGIMSYEAVHLAEHAAQIRAAAGVA